MARSIVEHRRLAKKSVEGRSKYVETHDKSAADDVDVDEVSMPRTHLFE